MSTTATPVEGRVYSASLALRDTQVTGTTHRYLEGRAAPYGVAANTGWYTELLAPGCFAKSIKEAARALPLLLFHDGRSMDSIIGMAESWEERADGLWGVWRLSDEEHAQRAARMAADGMLAHMSVGFVPIRSETVYDEQDAATITRLEARLVEVSLTPTPAYKDALVSKVRSAGVTGRAGVRPRLAAARRILSTLS